MNKKIPMRTCIVSREKLPKQELVRIVRNKEGEVFVDLTGKQNGSGVYLKKDLEVVNKAKSTKVLNKSLECDVPDSVFEELENLLK